MLEASSVCSVDYYHRPIILLFSYYFVIHSSQCTVGPMSVQKCETSAYIYIYTVSHIYRKNFSAFDSQILDRIINLLLHRIKYN